MRHRPPHNFEYTKDTENLFLFYQCINEMTFDYSPDTYKAPMLDTRLLVKEAIATYRFLVQSGTLEKYYSKYLGPVLVELKDSLQIDEVAKALLGNRYDRILSTINVLKENHGQFEAVMHNIRNYFDEKKYYYGVIEQLQSIIQGKKNQEKIVKLAGIWMTELLDLGYSKQHIYIILNEFFVKNRIDCSGQICDFFAMFTFEEQKWEILTLADKKLMSYIKGMDKIISIRDISFERVTEDELKALVLKKEYEKSNWFLQRFEALKRVEQLEIIRCYVSGCDPYKAVNVINQSIKLYLNIITNFDNESKNMYSDVLCLNYIKDRIKIQSAMERRNRQYVQSYLPNALKMLRILKMPKDMVNTFMKVLAYHGDAISKGLENKYVITMLWTAMETLFIEGAGIKGEQVKESLVAIIQRTYIVKKLKYLHGDFVQNIKSVNKELVEKYKVDDFKVFVELLFDEKSSPRKEELLATLGLNPLLRTRIYKFVEKDVKNANKINEVLEAHKTKIELQIERIYRSRNFLVHAGQSFWYEEVIVECLHNYLDFVINYLLVKIEKGEYIYSMKDVVTEAKMDNEIHYSMLSKNKSMETTSENYLDLLFGPADNVVAYYEDHIV